MRERGLTRAHAGFTRLPVRASSLQEEVVSESSPLRRAGALPTIRNTGASMEQLWSRAGANGRDLWVIGQPRKRLRQAESVAPDGKERVCDRLPWVAVGLPVKEGRLGEPWRRVYVYDRVTERALGASRRPT